MEKTFLNASLFFKPACNFIITPNGRIESQVGPASSFISNTALKTTKWVSTTILLSPTFVDTYQYLPVNLSVQ